MLPLITAALGLMQQNQQDKAARKKAMADSAMGQVASSAPPSNASGGGLAALGNIAGLLGGSQSPTAQAPQQPPLGTVNPDEILDPWANK